MVQEERSHFYVAILLTPRKNTLVPVREEAGRIQNNLDEAT
jgi:hypothetical protein